MLLFVYGTLCKGLSRNEVLKESEYLGFALCKGVLKDVGSFPAFINGDKDVIGEVYRIDPDIVLPILDRIEGYSKNNEAGSLYLRLDLPVRLLSTGKWVDAITYIFNRDAEGLRKIPNGDYRQYLLDQKGETIYYLAYGSNLSTSRMKKRIGSWKRAVKGYLADYRLTFNKRPSKGGRFAFANIIAGVEGNDCPCVAYEIERKLIPKLDKCEGTPIHYIRSVIPMVSEAGQELMGYIYIANPNQLVLNRIASDKYRKHIVQGYDDHKLGQLSIPNDADTWRSQTKNTSVQKK
jgi:gamma-glutamylcyclotransferase